MILCSKGIHLGIGNLEDVRDFMIGMDNDKYIEEMVNMLAILSQINLIIDRFYLDKGSDINELYCTLRKRILTWLQESFREPELDGQQYSHLLSCKWL